VPLRPGCTDSDDAQTTFLLRHSRESLSSQDTLPHSQKVPFVHLMSMTISKLAHNILSQPESSAALLNWMSGGGQEGLLEAAARLRSGRRVLITGIGASQYASIPFEYALCALGIEAVVIEAGELLHYQHPAYRDAVVLIVSRSGESIEIAKLLELLKGRQPIIGVTNEPDGLLAKTADCPLLIGSLCDEMVAIQTYTGTLLALYLLGGAIGGQFEVALDAVRSVQPAFARVIAENMDAIEEWDPFLDLMHPICLLARGPSCASALEGALLFNEIAKIPAVGLPVASFRHGPVEVVDEAFRGIIFAPQGPTREMTLSLGRDLIRFGGRICVVGPGPGLAGSHPAREIPALQDSLAPLLEIVPIQVAALRMAQLRGIVPGSFRYTAQVARDEANFGHVIGDPATR
jgi:glucosamine--fructose-6-phosphate aminotransferase (isomerizing)